ncbi:hypothetical protein CBM2634_A170058 [Cupriavidus taiwanensis]|uniref:Uncharacterized protein n=1 Tax=Cupriavidus taiwanensis TaxID=164546 RepID=A0A375IWM4_9BURK|nr:hypothetical protein CBM2634_A170058 [Cupriavidus taiwanensis]
MPPRNAFNLSYAGDLANNHSAGIFYREHNIRDGTKSKSPPRATCNRGEFNILV